MANRDEIFDLRWRVLRPGLDRREAEYPGDFDPGTFHVGAFSDGVSVGCATFLQNSWMDKPAWQLRGMGVSAELRGRGIGAEILRFAEQHIAQSGYSLQLWCNARTGAVPFYRRLGWVTVGEPFDVPGVGEHFKMQRLLVR